MRRGRRGRVGLAPAWARQAGQSRGACHERRHLGLRHACPGPFIGVSTGGWIERDEFRTLASIDAWDELPDYASVNLGERAAPAVMEKLRQRGIGIEAGLAAIADAERFAVEVYRSRPPRR